MTAPTTSGVHAEGGGFTAVCELCGWLRWDPALTRSEELAREHQGKCRGRR